jgi:hypothetical protein
MCAGSFGHIERPFTRDLNFDLIAFLQSERFNYRSGKPDREAIAPF